MGSQTQAFADQAPPPPLAHSLQAAAIEYTMSKVLLAGCQFCRLFPCPRTRRGPSMHLTWVESCHARLPDEKPPRLYTSVGAFVCCLAMIENIDRLFAKRWHYI